MVILNFLKNVPTELLEHEMPAILIRHYGLREDSGGAGRYRGGTGTIIEFETHSPFTTVTSRNMERYLFPPAGRLGGKPGTTGFTLLNPETNHPVNVGKIDILEMDSGDVLRIGTQGGGGYGDPLERPAATVWEDVLDGYVSIDAARADYGVVGTLDGGLDAAATEALRKKIRAERGKGPLKEFDFGPVRDAYHARWPAAMHDAVSASTQDLPRLQRQLSYQALYKEIDRMIDAGETVSPEQVPAILKRIQGSPRLSAGIKRNG
jgi:N-methylhydantoinase B